MFEITRIVDPPIDQLAKVLARPVFTEASVSETVAAIIEDVRLRGDEAVLEYSRRFDKVETDKLSVIVPTAPKAAISLDPALRRAIDRARGNIERFHAAQRPIDERVETEPGIYCWRRSVPIDTIGIYVPGGTAVLFSTVLMLALPAHLAGCRRIVLCTPPQGDGSINPAILYAASISGVTDLFAVGGAQAIAAMAYGTHTIPKVDKIFGPGNRYVTEAKLQVSSRVCAIDMPAGPSEVMVVVDESVEATFVAADLLSQAEHGPDSQAILVVKAQDERSGHILVDAITAQVRLQLDRLPRKELAAQSLAHSKAVIVTKEPLVAQVINAYGPEHLLLQTSDFDKLEEQVVNAGSVFLGACSCESAGDYASGTNHTLPTYGWARSHSGVSLDSYFKKITFQRVTLQGLRSLGPDIEVMARAEALDAHAAAVRIRLDAPCEDNS